MPPPPMVPGKHNMDIGTWDSPKNGSPMVPTPPPVITVPSPIEPSPLSQSKSSNAPAPAPATTPPNSGSSSQQQSVGSMSGNMLGQNMHSHQRPSGLQIRPWSGPNNRAPHPNMMAPMQHQRSNIGPGQGELCCIF